MSDVSEGKEEDEGGGSVGDGFCRESVLRREEEDGDDGVLTRCWGAVGTPEEEEEEEEEVSPAGTSGPFSRSCCPVPSSFRSSGRAPSFCFLLAVASSCPAGL